MMHSCRFSTINHLASGSSSRPISGAGVAGPVLAFFLSIAGANVSIIERVPDLRTGGQNVDVRGIGLEVVRRMGLEAAVRDRMTHEEGLAFVDASDRRAAEFPVDPSGRALSMTAEIEIMRGDLVKIFYEATRKDVQYIFANSIRDMMEHDDKVTVKFKNHEKQEFDLVIAADGLGSSIRALMLDNSQKSPIRSLAQYVSWFTVPRAVSDGNWARWYNAPGRRLILVRTDTGGAASRLSPASLWICSTSERLQSYSKLNVQEQKTLMRDLFNDAGWKAPRVLAGMDAAEDFYMQEVAQVKMNSSWSRGRVALLGDAAYCPSPISRMGTTVAILGAYILAGEIARNPTDHRAPFESYECIIRPFIANAQKLVPGTPWIANPETSWGISILNGFLGLFLGVGLRLLWESLLGRLFTGSTFLTTTLRCRGEAQVPSSRSERIHAILFIAIKGNDRQHVANGIAERSSGFDLGFVRPTLSNIRDQYGDHVGKATQKDAEIKQVSQVQEVKALSTM